MISIKTPEEIKIMAEGAKILAEVLEKVARIAKPGITTLELNNAAEKLILEKGARPAFKGYEGFPYSLCASVNEEIVHGLPSKRVLKERDVVGLDLGVLYKEYNSDMAITVPVGEVSFEAKRLISVTKQALKIGIKEVKPGKTMGDIGSAVQKYIESQGFGVVRELCGHGIGKEIHEDPKIPNYGQKGKGEVLKEGMVICIEPMVTIGDWHLEKSEDGFGYRSKDKSLTAHFEHTIAVTKKGAKILTIT